MIGICCNARFNFWVKLCYQEDAGEQGAGRLS